MEIKRLQVPFEVKAVQEDGFFSGYGSVFGVVDSYGDVVDKGAFEGTLKAWEKKGGLPSLLWQHKQDEPIGIYTAMKEDDHGLFVEGRLLIDDDPLAKRAYAHLKAGSVRGLSIGFSIFPKGAFWDDKAGVYHLTNLKLWEVSLVTFPANEEAQISAVKAACREASGELQRRAKTMRALQKLTAKF